MCWDGLAALVPALRIHIRSRLQPESNQPVKERDLERASFGNDSSDATAMLKELFCVSACDLATSMQGKLDDLGILYENTMTTGTVKGRSKCWNLLRGMLRHALGKSNSSTRNGSGHMLFFVRVVNRSKVQVLQNAGFRFATLPQVLSTLAHSMEVAQDQLGLYMEDMRVYSTTERTIGKGVHLACFAMRPLLQRGFDILVARQAKNIVPTVPLKTLKLEPWHTEILNELDNLTVAECLESIESSSNPFKNSNRQSFRRDLADAVHELANQIGPNLFQEARFCARTFEAPCASVDPPTIIAFRVIVDAHQISDVNERLMFSSSRLFLAQQHAYKESIENEKFNACARQELVMRVRGFGYRFSASGPRSSAKSFKHGRHPSRVWPFIRGNDTSSMTGLIGSDPPSPYPQVHRTDEIHVDIQEDVPSLNTDMELLRTDNDGCVVGLSAERHTFAETLMALTMGDYRSSISPH